VVCANCHRIRTWQRHQARPPCRPWGVALPGSEADELASTGDDLDRCRAVPCSDCGERYPPCAMDFDHRDPSTKRAAVTRMIGRAGTQRLLDEIAKCDIVCANCHRLRTSRRRSAATARE
jgi:hypothetical protein